MEAIVFYQYSGLALLVIGLHGLQRSSHLLRKILAANLMASGVFLVLVAGAYRSEGPPDPVPHALVLTGIVVAVSTTAVALVLACLVQEQSNRAVWRRSKQTKPEEKSR
ncbi:MAG: cation:proton antiporter subunit C [Thermodesulfobacteriota bacterium]